MVEIQIMKRGNEYWDIMRVERKETTNGPIVLCEVLSRVWLDTAQGRYVIEMAIWDGAVGAKPKWLRVGPSFLNPDLAFKFIAEGGKAKA